jgi:hypothetical protein
MVTASRRSPIAQRGQQAGQGSALTETEDPVDARAGAQQLDAAGCGTRDEVMTAACRRQQYMSNK